MHTLWKTCLYLYCICVSILKFGLLFENFCVLCFFINKISKSFPENTREARRQSVKFWQHHSEICRLNDHLNVTTVGCWTFNSVWKCISYASIGLSCWLKCIIIFMLSKSTKPYPPQDNGSIPILILLF